MGGGGGGGGGGMKGWWRMVGRGGKGGESVRGMLVVGCFRGVHKGSVRRGSSADTLIMREEAGTFVNQTR